MIFNLDENMYTLAIWGLLQELPTCTSLLPLDFQEVFLTCCLFLSSDIYFGIKTMKKNVNLPLALLLPDLGYSTLSLSAWIEE